MVYVLLSPAKKMSVENVRQKLRTTAPHFTDETIVLSDTMRKFTPSKLKTLMDISDALAKLNAERFKAFGTQDTQAGILAFQGDTYVGFDAKTLDDAQLKAAQNHVGILSGLYGVLRPLDAIEPYRLEMGSRVAIDRATDLYGFWGDKVTKRVAALAKKSGAKAVIGCASQEYLKVVDTQKLGVPFIQCDFKEMKNGKATTIGLFAKRARGMMARYVVENGVTDVKALQKFAMDGYAFDKTLSDDAHFVFVRARKGA